MAEIVFLASYPRSGNTWMRIYLENFLYATNRDLDLNSLKLPLFNAASRVLFDSILGLKASELPMTDVNRLRPLVLQTHAMDEEGLVFSKIHDALYPDSPQSLLIPVPLTRCIIYIIRNPLDVAVSMARFFGIGMDKAIDRLNDENYTLSHPQGGIGLQLPQKIKSWSLHVKSWTVTKGIVSRVIRYEDMLTKPVATFSSMIESLGLNVEWDNERIKTAIKESSFNRLKAMEEKSGFSERHAMSERFFHTGQSGTWHGALTRNQVNRIVEKHGPVMEAYNYL